MPRTLLLLGLLALGAPAALAQFGPSPVEDTWEERRRKALADMSPAERARYDDFLRRTGDPEAAERYAVEMEELYDRIDDIEKRKDQLTPEQYRRERGQVYDSMNGVLQTEMDTRTRELYFQVLRPDLEQSGYPGLPKPDDPPPGPILPPDIADMDEEQRQEYYRRALEEARRALAKDPANAAALLKQASALAQLGDWAGAVSAADRVLAKDPANPNALAIIKLSAGRGGPSSADQGAADEAGGGDFPSLTGPGAVQGPSGLPPDLRAAADRLERAMRVKDYAGALKELNTLIEKDPRLSVAYAQRAEALLRLRRFAEAERDIEETLRRGVGNRENWLRLQRLAQDKLSRYRDMKAAAERALKADPKSAKAFNDLARAEAGLGSREAMIAALRQAAMIDGPAYGGRYRLALKLPDEADLLALFDETQTQPAAQAPPASPFPVSILLGAGLVVGALTTFFLFFRRRSSGLMSAAPTPSAGGEEAGGGSIPTGYRVLRQIGSGGMGAVYEAEDVSLQRRVAIKRMREEIRSDPRECERFLTEARLVAKLKHENIIEIYHILENEGELYLVFEFIDGRTLDQFLAEKPLSLEQARSLVRQSCAALAYAHGRGIIHRDLKPSNIMITGEGRIKVMDLGIARQAKDAMDKLSLTNTVAGTPQYMAPESEQGVVRPESDLYSLAIVAYEALCGEHPFAGIGAGILLNKLNMNFRPLSQRRAGLPPALDAFFSRALRPEPDQRPRTAAAFASAFDEALFGPPKPEKNPL
ncbi:MAG TPA: hypothetical protein DCM05_12665 [Elusimicrobia bacterium]|nr:hypothetical protein [Elusimicrobiota bacterium]